MQPATAAAFVLQFRWPCRGVLLLSERRPDVRVAIGVRHGEVREQGEVRVLRDLPVLGVYPAKMELLAH